MRKENFVLSITSIPDRINLFLSNLSWLLNQTIQPDIIIIWLGSEYFSNLDIKEFRTRFSLPNNIEFRIRPDLGPHTKLIYALNEFCGIPIVTADDDIIYPSSWLEELYCSYLSSPEYIHCFRAHGMRFLDNFDLAPYLEWDWLSNNLKGPSFRLFPTGTSGIIYPAKVLSDHVFDVDNMRKLCPTADDIWFKAMSLLNKTKVQKVFPDSIEFPKIEGAEDQYALWKINVKRNDIYLENVFRYYNINDFLPDNNIHRNSEFSLYTPNRW